MAPTPPAAAGEGDEHLRRNKQAGTPWTVMRLKLDLIAATNRQPIAELLTALAYLVAVTGLFGLVFAISSIVAH
jgi:hypothetical protein